MIPDYISPAQLTSFIQTALAEDVGDGDHSSMACIPDSSVSTAVLKIKDKGILAGIELALQIFQVVDPRLKVVDRLEDGSAILPGDVAFRVQGPTQSILKAERVVLNCMQRMSAIATKTRHFSELISGTGAILLDTRKTTPNFRMMEKWAVLIGGGQNHRYGLFDMIMLKDNHIMAAGGVESAIIRTKDYLRTLNKNLRIEIEASTVDQVKQILAVGGVDVIMLDNMAVPMVKECVRLIGGRFKTEASGGISESTIGEIAACGVDYISVGELTHSVRSLDMSLKIVG